MLMTSWLTVCLQVSEGSCCTYNGAHSSFQTYKANIAKAVHCFVLSCRMSLRGGESVESTWRVHNGAHDLFLLLSARAWNSSGCEQEHGEGTGVASKSQNGGDIGISAQKNARCLVRSARRFALLCRFWIFWRKECVRCGEECKRWSFCITSLCRRLCVKSFFDDILSADRFVLPHSADVFLWNPRFTDVWSAYRSVSPYSADFPV